MAVLIKDMEMPKSCWSCRMFCNCYACEGYNCHCAALGEDIGTETELPRDKRRDDCPLVPVPPHGDLIDRDALPWEKQSLMVADEDWALPCVLIEDAPIIIPADPAEDGE